MNASYLPPSLKKNNWLLYICVLLGLTLVFSLLLTVISWNWFSEWKYLSNPLRIWWDSLQGKLPITFYWQNIKFLQLEMNFYLHLFVPFIFSIFVSLILVWKFLYKLGGKTLEIKIRGVDLIESKAVKRHANKKNKVEIVSSCDGGLMIHPHVQLSKKRELNNILITGMQGAGKTVVVFGLLQQLIARLCNLFIFDQKREYTEKFYDEDTILIAPWDKRGVSWNISADLPDKTSAFNFAKRIIVETPQPFWSTSSVLMLTGMIVALQKSGKTWGWKELYTMTEINSEELISLLSENSPGLIKYIDSNNETSSGVLMNLQSNIGWMEYLAEYWPNSKDATFSIKEWVNGENQPKKVIIQSHNRYKALAEPLFNALFSVLTTEFLVSERTKTKETFLILDEFGNLKRMTALHEWLSTARESQGKAIIGTQSISQIFEVYGEHDTNSMLSMCGNVISLRVGSLGTDAEYISKAFGEKIVERPSFNEGNSTNWSKDIVQAVLPSELIHLPIPDNKGVHGYLTVNGWNATYRLTWGYSKLEGKAERYIPSQSFAKTIAHISLESVTTPDRVLRRRNANVNDISG